MTKALDYLYAMKCTNEQMGQEPISIIEAIKELEDLQNRSCKNCKFGMEYHFDDEIECFKIEADTQGMYFSNDFCCNKWEPK